MFVGQNGLAEATCAEQFPVGPDDRAPHRMPEQGDIVRIRGDERFAQVLSEASSDREDSTSLRDLPLGGEGTRFRRRSCVLQIGIGKGPP
jgi:hypothetical protein